jgi:ribosomal protein S15P/S13E
MLEEQKNEATSKGKDTGSSKAQLDFNQRKIACLKKHLAPENNNKKDFSAIKALREAVAFQKLLMKQCEKQKKS